MTAAESRVADRWGRQLGAAVGLATALAVLVPAVVAQPLLTLLAGALVVAVVVSFVHPPVAAYLLIATSPLLAGMDRGAVIPVLRPNEALALLLVATVLARRLLIRVRGTSAPRVLSAAEASILFLVVAGSLLPLASMLLRGRAISQLDLFYALVLWKCLGIYLVVRTTIRTDRQVRTCLMVAMVAAAVTAVVGILQALHLLGVPGLISRFYAPEGYASSDATRWGTSTIGHAQAMGDVMAFNLAIALAWLSHALPARRLVIGFAALFVLGAVTSAEFSSAIAVTLAAGTVAIVTGTFRRSMLRLVPIVLVAAVVLQPVIRSRLDEFSSPQGIPPSWSGRVHNLETYVVPELTRDYNYSLGVSPTPRVIKSKDPFEYGYIESGHLWLLWTGGVPFLLAFAVFIIANLRVAHRVARNCPGAIGMAGVASLAALVVVLVLTTLDPHLTFRGAAELNFSLLALAHLGVKARARPSEPIGGTPGGSPAMGAAPV